VKRDVLSLSDVEDSPFSRHRSLFSMAVIKKALVPVLGCLLVHLVELFSPTSDRWILQFLLANAFGAFLHSGYTPPLLLAGVSRFMPERRGFFFYCGPANFSFAVVA